MVLQLETYADIVPTFVWLFFKLITPFIDPNTREKLKFNENLRDYVPSDQLMELFGGDCKFEYEHEVFWPAYLKLAAERRESYFSNWKALGGGIGLSEWDLRAKVDSAAGEERNSNGDTSESEETETVHANNGGINVQD
jgi:hypothetical protein